MITKDHNDAVNKMQWPFTIYTFSVFIYLYIQVQTRT